MKRKMVLPLFAAVAVFMLFSPASSQARTTHMKAQNSTHSSTSAAAQREAMWMVPAEAVLKDRINARKIQDGDQFQASLSRTIDLKNGLKLPKGTELIGTVARDKMHADGTSSLALRFTQAKLRDGKVVPIKATIVGVSAPESYYSSWQGSIPPAYWNDKTLRVNQINAESGVNMRSAIASKNSAVFETAKKDDVKLPAGAQLSLAIGARKSGSRGIGAAGAGVSSGA